MSNLERQKRNVVAIAGLETIKDKKTDKVKFFADTFLDNIKTWVKDYPNDAVKILDARTYKDHLTPMDDMWLDIKIIPNIDLMLFSCHSDWEGLYIFSKYRRGEIEDCHRYIEYTTSWNGIAWSKNAHIKIMGCQAGGRFGKKWDNSIAQDIANKTDTTVWAFCSKSSQRKRKDGGYVQIPDVGGYVKFVKVVKNV